MKELYKYIYEGILDEPNHHTLKSMAVESILDDELCEGILDDDDVFLKDFPIDLYSLIKDRIGRITYKYTSLGFTRSINTSKCKKLSKSLDAINPINGKLPTNGKDTFASLPILLSNIYVKPSFITHKNDASYLESSAKQSSKFIEDNDLYGTEFSRFGSSNFNNSYIFVEMVNGHLMIYYKSGNNLNNAIKPTISSITGKSSRGWGYIKITLVNDIKEDITDDDLYEGILDDEDVFMDNMDKSLIEKFIKDNYLCYGNIRISDKPNKAGKYEVSSNDIVTVRNKHIASLTNNLFVWSIIDSSFNCAACKRLKSLEGAPKEVGGYFNCSGCNLLTSLKHVPKKINRSLYCEYCDNLTSLEGAPKEVGWNFYCHDCKRLKSLEGAPKEVGGDFYCDGCVSLTSLKGAPKNVRGDFLCRNCNNFTEDDVLKVSDVKGKIFC